MKRPTLAVGVPDGLAQRLPVDLGIAARREGCQNPGIFGIHSHSEGLLLAYRGEVAAARAAGLAQIRESAARAQGVPADLGNSPAPAVVARSWP
jgi:hypothetical protein